MSQSKRKSSSTPPPAPAPSTPPSPFDHHGKKSKLPTEPEVAFKQFAQYVQGLEHGGSVITVADSYDINRNKVIDRKEFSALVERLGFVTTTEVEDSLFEHVLKYESEPSSSPSSPSSSVVSSRFQTPRPKEQKQQNPSFGYFTFIKAINDSLFVTPSKRRVIRDHVLYWSPKDVIASWQVRFALQELDIEYTPIETQGTTVDPSEFEGTPPLRRKTPLLIVNKFGVESILSGPNAILLYLAHTKALVGDPKLDELRYAKAISRFHETRELAKILAKDNKSSGEQLRAELEIWIAYLEKEDYLATSFSIADIALFPLLATVQAQAGGKLPTTLVNYYKRIASRTSVEATWPASVEKF